MLKACICSLEAPINFEMVYWRLLLCVMSLTGNVYLYHVLDVSSAHAATSATDAWANYGSALSTVGPLNWPPCFGAEVQCRFCNNVRRKKPPSWPVCLRVRLAVSERKSCCLCD